MDNELMEPLAHIIVFILYVIIADLMYKLIFK